METVYLSWNFTNWITVVLMAALGFMALALVAQVFQLGKSKSSASPVSTSEPALVNA